MSTTTRTTTATLAAHGTTRTRTTTTRTAHGATRTRGGRRRDGARALAALALLLTLGAPDAVRAQDTPARNDVLGTQASAVRVPDDLGQAVADLELTLVVQPDPSDLGDRVRALMASAVAIPDADARVDVLARLASAWARRLADMERAGEADALLDPRSGWVAELARASGWDDDAARTLGNAVEGDARVRGVQERVDAMVRGEGAASAEMLATVRAALADKDVDLLDQLGLRAVPALEELVDLTVDERTWARDPLYWLLELSRDRGMRLVREAFHGDGPIHVPYVAGRIRPLFQNDSSLWFQARETPGRFVRSEWAEIPLAMLEPRWYPADDPGRLLALLSEFASRDAFSTDMAIALADVYTRREVRGDRHAFDGLVDGSPFGFVGRSTLRPFFEIVVEDPADHVRRKAAERLVDYDRSDALLARVRDVDHEVRVSVARSLGVRRVPRWGGAVTVRPMIDDAASEVLWTLGHDVHPAVRVETANSLVSHDGRVATFELFERLCGDADPDVRLAMTLVGPGVGAEWLERLLVGLANDEHPRVRDAVAQRVPRRGDPASTVLAVAATLVEDSQPSIRAALATGLAQRSDIAVPTDLAVKLAEDPDPDVRRSVLAMSSLEPRAQLAVLMRLVDDDSMDVLQAVNHALLRVPPSEHWGELHDALMPMFRQRFESPRATLELERALSGSPLNTPEGRLAVTRWALQADTPRHWDAALISNGAKNLDALFELDDHDLARVLVELQARNRNEFGRMVEAVSPNSTTHRPGVGRRLLGDASFSSVLRLKGARILGPSATVEELGHLGELLEVIDADDSFFGDLRVIGGLLPGGLRDDFARALLELDAPDEVVQYVMRGYLDEGSPAPDVVAGVLDRWFAPDAPGGVNYGIVESALAVMARVPAAVDEDVLRRAVESDYARPAMKTIASLRDPRFVDIMGRHVRNDGMKSLEQDRRSFALDGLVALATDEAVAELLDAARSTGHTGIRAALLDAVAKIQDYQDTLAAWETRKNRTATRDDTVAELVAMLEDRDPVVRAEAARGLGTLGAVDRLPALIRMLRDEDARVAAAARAALDALNTAATPADGEDAGG